MRVARALRFALCAIARAPAGALDQTHHKTAWTWDVLLGSGSDKKPVLLADAAEAVDGYQLSELRSLILPGDHEQLRMLHLFGGTGSKPDSGVYPLAVPNARSGRHR
jgi:hypothetical protein